MKNWGNTTLTTLALDFFPVFKGIRHKLKPSPKLTSLLFVLSTGFPGINMYADELYVVKPGDTLWDISEKFLNNAQEWKQLQTLNNIINPDKLLPDSKIRIPGALLKESEPQSVIKYLYGDVRITTLSGKSKSTAKGTPINNGDSITTGKDASIGFEFASGTSSLVLENSEISVKNIDISKEKENIHLHLNKGVISSDVNPKKKSETRFIISTPSAVASVRGTQFRVANDPLTHQFRTEVLEGKVAVSSEGESKIVEKGFGIVVKKGEAPKHVTQLLAAVDLSQVNDKFIHPPFFFSFSPLEKALGYRIEISKGNTFNIPFYTQDLVKPSFSIKSLDNDTYTLKVFAYDQNGLGGKIAFHQFSVHVKSVEPAPKLPELIFPNNKMLLQKKNFIFRWTKPINANGYHFQLASDKKFSQLMIDIFPYYFTELAISDRLPSGIYYWHVASLNKQHKPVAYTDSRSFRIPPETPVLTRVDFKDDNIMLMWAKVKDDLHYQIQISQDRQFNQLLTNKKLNSNHFQYETDNIGHYFIRVKAIEKDGYIGENSKTLHLKLSKKGFFDRKLTIIKDQNKTNLQDEK